MSFLRQFFFCLVANIDTGDKMVMLLIAVYVGEG
jgi:hypothetical protein